MLNETKDPLVAPESARPTGRKRWLLAAGLATGAALAACALLPAGVPEADALEEALTSLNSDTYQKLMFSSGCDSNYGYNMCIKNNSGHDLLVKWDRNSKYVTESFEKASSSAGFSVSGGYGGAEGSVGANWSKENVSSRKFMHVLASRGFVNLSNGYSNCAPATNAQGNTLSNREMVKGNNVWYLSVLDKTNGKYTAGKQTSMERECRA